MTTVILESKHNVRESHHGQEFGIHLCQGICSRAIASLRNIVTTILDSISVIDRVKPWTSLLQPTIAA